ncbi:MAG: cytochrome c3 family protein [Pseudomonadota bacterium]
MRILLKIVALVLAAWVAEARADEALFGTTLWPKFQAKACTTCHDFFEKERNGQLFGTHQARTPAMCMLCHTTEVNGFEHPDEWFARPGLYLSGMDAVQTCEAVKKALNAESKSESLLARQMQIHLFTDPRVLWGIAGATPKSGQRPDGSAETDLVKGGMDEWRKQVLAWIAGGMKCE